MDAEDVLHGDDPSCRLCGQIFDIPRVLCCTSCGRSFCTSCLTEFWETCGSRVCPRCPVERPAPCPETCRDHGLQLTVFCLEELSPVCTLCLDSGGHTGHRVHLLQEIIQDCKAELKAALKPLQEKLKLFRDLKLTYDLTAEHIKRQTEHTERQIRDEFEALRQFLQDEEAARLSDLKREEAHKSQVIMEKIAETEDEVTALTNTIRHIEKEMSSLDIPFLQNYKDTIKRTWNLPRDPEMIAGSLVDVAKHLGSLKFKVWEKMKNIVHYTPVTLDPNTAASCFQVSEDLTTLQCCPQIFKLPNNVERFDVSAELLGSEGYNSGKHSWEVYVKGNTYWVIGVASESVKRKGKNVLTPAEGFWTIRLRNGEYKACSAPWAPLSMSAPPDVVRVVLDMDRSKVMFYDPRERTPLYTFTDILAVRAFPYFCSADRDYPLRVQPCRVTVKVEH